MLPQLLPAQELPAIGEIPTMIESTDVKPLFSDFDLHLFGEGQLWEIYERLGAHIANGRWADGREFRRLGAECRGRQRRWRFQSLGRSIRTE